MLPRVWEQEAVDIYGRKTMILAGQQIRKIEPLRPFHERTVRNGMSYGLSHAGYDVRIAQACFLSPNAFCLASTMEEFSMPDDLVAFVHDKSTWARRGLSLFNTVIEPGWNGFLTLELVNHSDEQLMVSAGDPIAQIIFMRMEEPAEKPYTGKYQNQKRGPQEAIDER
jgi:dCTP deaminase